MNKKNLIAWAFLAFVILILGCARQEQKSAEKSAAANAENPQQTPQNINESASTGGDQQILNEISSTESLDSALKELDSVE